MIDISEYVDNLEITYKPEESSFFVAGLQSLGPFAISGTWHPTDAFADIAIRVAFAGRRAPRRTKKALKKAWIGRPLTHRERGRISRLRLNT